MNARPLVLASRSPRRAALLREAGYAVTVASPPFDDPAAPQLAGASPQAHAEELALQKAASLCGHVGPEAVILAADTIVLADAGDGGQPLVLGQPQSRDEAAAMLRRLIDRTHRVVTGVALYAGDGSRHETFHDTARVHLGRLDAAERERYLDSGDWAGKAGGYNLHELQHWPFTIEGDATTVVGLPMTALAQRLHAWSITPAEVHPGGGSHVTRKHTG